MTGVVRTIIYSDLNNDQGSLLKEETYDQQGQINGLSCVTQPINHDLNETLVDVKFVSKNANASFNFDWYFNEYGSRVDEQQLLSDLTADTLRLPLDQLMDRLYATKLNLAVEGPLRFIGLDEEFLTYYQS